MDVGAEQPVLPCARQGAPPRVRADVAAGARRAADPPALARARGDRRRTLGRVGDRLGAPCQLHGRAADGRVRRGAAGGVCGAHQWQRAVRGGRRRLRAVRRRRARQRDREVALRPRAAQVAPGPQPARAATARAPVRAPLFCAQPRDVAARQRGVAPRGAPRHFPAPLLGLFEDGPRRPRGSPCGQAQCDHDAATAAHQRAGGTGGWQLGRCGVCGGAIHHCHRAAAAARPGTARCACRAVAHGARRLRRRHALRRPVHKLCGASTAGGGAPLCARCPRGWH